MNNHYIQEDRSRDDLLLDLNYHIPEWAKLLVEIYTSARKYEMESVLKNEHNHHE